MQKEAIARLEDWLQFKKIAGSQHIKQWESFLSGGENKLFYKWDGSQCCIWYIFVNLRPNGESQLRLELSCNYEETDIGMFLHAEEISHTNIRNIVINTPDTDVFLIGITASNQINTNLFIRTGTGKKAQIISVSKVKEALQMKYVLINMQLVTNTLLGLHAYTGCDTVSAFSGKSTVLFLVKVKWNHWNWWWRMKSTSARLQSGEEEEISTSSFDALVEFVCELYGHKENSTDYVRYKLYTLTFTTCTWRDTRAETLYIPQEM